jgi:hypothetical protein
MRKRCTLSALLSPRSAVRSAIAALHELRYGDGELGDTVLGPEVLREYLGPDGVQLVKLSAPGQKEVVGTHMDTKGDMEWEGYHLVQGKPEKECPDGVVVS